MKRWIESCRSPRFWTKGIKDLSYSQAHRAKALASSLGCALPVAEGMSDGPLTFSLTVPHGEPNGRGGTVMMTRLLSYLNNAIHKTLLCLV